MTIDIRLYKAVTTNNVVESHPEHCVYFSPHDDRGAASCNQGSRSKPQHNHLTKQIHPTMPPKQKKKGTAAAQAAAAEPIPYDDLPLQQLQSTVAELEQKHSSVLDAANLANTEHDAVLSYYEVTKDKLHELNLEIEQAERTVEQAQEDHGLELSVYDDRLKRVQYDHGNSMKAVTEEGLQANQASRDHHNHRLQNLEEAKREVLLETREMQVLQTEEIHEAKKRHGRQLQAERVRLDEEVVHFRRQCQDHHAAMVEDAELQRRGEVRRAEERGAGRLEQLEAQHRARLDEVTDYFEGIVSNNRVVIRSLRDEINRLEDCADRSSRAIAELTEENERLAEPLAQVMEQMRVLAAQSRDYEKDAEVLMNTKGRIGLNKKRIKDVQKDYEELQKRYDEANIHT